MKTLTSEIFVKLTDSNDPKRTFKIEKDTLGWISIGTGSNPDYPQVNFHPDDVEKLIETINAVVKTKLPAE